MAQVNFIDEIVAALGQDEELMALLPGGIYSGSLIREISRQNTPEVFDANGEILPSLLVVVSTDVRIAPHHRGLVTTFSAMFYQRSGYDIIEEAMAKVYELLHEARVGEGTCQILFSASVENQVDTALDCSLSSQRWMAYRIKPAYVPDGSGS